MKTFKPTSPGLRQRVAPDFREVTETKPWKPLLTPLVKSAGRNNTGRITSRHRGGGHKRQYRLIDFHRNKLDLEGIVEAIEYDPNRTARIARVLYKDGERRYILGVAGMKVGDRTVSSPEADPKDGNTLPLRQIPVGTLIHGIELYPASGAQLVRSAGVAAQLLAKEGDHAHIRLPSGEMRLVPLVCKATVGQVGTLEHENEKLGKAGRTRWLGIRPQTRGMAMNPCDHPHGGGEGRSKSGSHPTTPWGKPSKGYKTRHNPKTDRMIVRRRRVGYGSEE